jgi:hypothetical protein
MPVKTIPAIAASLLLTVLLQASAADEKPAAPTTPPGMMLAYQHDFEDLKTDRYEPTDPTAWTLQEQSGNHVMSLTKRDSNFKPPFRSPFGRSLIRDFTASTFVMDIRLQSTIKDYNHRDLCLFFGYQDDAHLYYVHFGKNTDDHANQIFIVNNEARKKISTKTTSGTPWTDGRHHTRIERNAESGDIRVFFDDMTTPVMTATDKNFTSGRLGFGSFDDIGNFDDIRIYVPETKSNASLKKIDLNSDESRQVTLDRDPKQYLGHPTTLLLEDGRTILCVYPEGHGKGPVIYRRSLDAGLTWSDRLPTPESWKTSKETPTLFRTLDASGKKRVLMFSGLYPIRLAVSEDDGVLWSELNAIGDFGGIVAMSSVEAVDKTPGHYMALFHDDGRFIRDGAKPTKPMTMTLFQSRSTDGGLTWSQPEVIHASTEYHLCEPGLVRSPDGKQLAVLLRENSRRHNSQIIFSDDEGKTWSKPRDLPDSLNGDRHTAKYSNDGRLLISFRRYSPKGKSCEFEGDWVAWVGRYEDLVNNSEGQYLVRLKDNQHKWDCAYPGVEHLADDTMVLTTYGHWQQGQPPWIISVRLKLAELDQLASK